MKKLWFLLIPATLWGVAALHEVAGLSLKMGVWYSYPLFTTYCLAVLLSIIIAVWKGI